MLGKFQYFFAPRTALSIWRDVEAGKVGPARSNPPIRGSEIKQRGFWGGQRD